MHIQRWKGMNGNEVKSILTHALNVSYGEADFLNDASEIKVLQLVCVENLEHRTVTKCTFTSDEQ